MSTLVSFLNPQSSVTRVRQYDIQTVLLVSNVASPDFSTCYNFTPQQSVTLLGYNFLSATSKVELLDLNGNILGTVISTTPSVLGAVTANTKYVIRWTKLGPGPGGNDVVVDENLFYLQATVNITNNTFFTNGLTPVINPTSSLSFTVNSYGGITFNFVGYPLSIGQILPLAQANNALTSGTINVTSSDATVFANAAFPFVSGQFVDLSGVALKTTIFTGTVYYNTATAGTSVTTNFAAAPAT